eukprot:1722784-Prymnesium_polylepis.1
MVDPQGGPFVSNMSTPAGIRLVANTPTPCIGDGRSSVKVDDRRCRRTASPDMNDARDQNKFSHRPFPVTYSHPVYGRKFGNSLILP